MDEMEKQAVGGLVARGLAAAPKLWSWGKGLLGKATGVAKAVPGALKSAPGKAFRLAKKDPMMTAMLASSAMPAPKVKSVQSGSGKAYQTTGTY